MRKISFSIAAIVLFGLSGLATAAQDVGSMVTLRGKAQIQRGEETLDAKLRDGIVLKDTIETGDRSRAKILFIDESMLTLASKSRASIENFVYSKAEGGASIFNLLDGKMRTVVGKTAFEVHTPTSVAAARGTVIEFFVGEKDGKPFTVITCLEGTVNIQSVDPSIVGEVALSAGQTITVFQSEPLPEPEPAPVEAPSQEAEESEEGEEAEEVELEDDEAIVTPTVVITPPVEQEPSTTTPVNINVTFGQ
jgi:ferric-dicitrate binding protein FerR (iron transport regulator)